MDAIILAAGLGTRLRPHTLTTPKPLLPVQGRPILDWTLGALPAVVDRVLVVTHYLAEQVDKYLSQQTHRSACETVYQAKPRGTGDALRCCQERLRSDTFLVLNGDDLYGAADIAALAACSAGLLVQTVQDPERWGIAFRKADGSLEKLVEKPKDLRPPQMANAGAYVFPREVFQIELTESPRGEYEITQYVDTLARTRRVEVIPVKFWLPIGTVEVWQAAQNMDLGALRPVR